MFDIFKSRPSDEEKGKDNNSKKVEPSNKNEGSTNKESSAPKIQITDNNPYNKAIESAISEYNKEVDGLLNQQTPEYKEKIEFSYALEYENSFFDDTLEKIKKDLIENKVLDPAKDITPRSIEKAASITRTAEKISSAPVLETLSYIAPEGLESKKLYKEVADDWDKKVAGNDPESELSFTNALNSLLEKVYFDGQDTIYTRTDQGLISAIAKILQGEGIKNPIIDESVKIYEERITKILEESGDKKGIESNKEEKSNTENKLEATSINTEQKIETINSPNKESDTKKSTTETIGTKLETPVSTIEPAKEIKKESPLKLEEKPTAAVTKEEIKEVEKTVTKEKEVTSETGTTKATNDIFAGTPLEGIMGSSKEAIATISNEPVKLEGKIDAVKETEVKSNTVTEKTPESIIEPNKVSAIETTNTKKSENKGKIGNMIKSFFSKEKKETPVVLSEVGKMGNKVETLPNQPGIKETEIQKLNTALPVISPTKETKVEEPKKQEEAPVNKELVNLASQQEKIINESLIKNSSDERIVESISKIEKDIKHSNEELGKKVDTMIGLLALLNDTLQSPLLVKNTSKNY